MINVIINKMITRTYFMRTIRYTETQIKRVVGPPREKWWVF